MRAEGGAMRKELDEIAETVRAEQRRRAEEANAASDREREQRIEAAAQAFYEARLEHLPDLLRQAASKGQFDHLVWRLSPSAHDLHTEEHEAKMRGLRRVVTWIKDQGLVADLQDDGGEQVPDYGYVHTITLHARWGDGWGDR